MTDFQSEMNRTVQGFVAQIAELARRAAINTLESAFTGRPQSGGSPGAASARTTARPTGRPRGRSAGGKRSPADLEALAQRLASFVKANPGLRIEQINKELGTATKDLALPVRKLVAEGVLTAKGTKRATTYFPGKKSAKN